MAREAPSADELMADPTVQAAFAAAWSDSFPDDPLLRHEEGGYIFIRPSTMGIIIRRSLPGGYNGIDLSFPPNVDEAYLVATYHTHPHPPDRVWIAEPSAQDRQMAYESGVPWFVISHEGIFWTGNERRVGGFDGPNGYTS